MHNRAFKLIKNQYHEKTIKSFDDTGFFTQYFQTLTEIDETCIIRLTMKWVELNTFTRALFLIILVDFDSFLKNEMTSNAGSGTFFIRVVTKMRLMMRCAKSKCFQCFS